MTNLFASIDASIGETNISVKLDAQVANVVQLATTIAGLINHPPQAIGDLSLALNELPLPKLQFTGNLSANLKLINDAVPADLSEVTGKLIEQLQALQDTVDTELIQSLKSALDVLLAIYRLTQIDLRCDESAQPKPKVAPVAALAAALSGTASDMNADSEPASGAATDLTAATTQIQAANQILDLAPSPFNVEAFLTWSHSAFASLNLQGSGPQPLPIVTDLFDALDTLLTWKSMAPIEIRSHIGATLQDLGIFIRKTVPGELSSLVSDLTATVPHLQSEVLAMIADDLTAQLEQLRIAVAAGNEINAGVAVVKINKRLIEYADLRVMLKAQLLDKLPSLNGRLSTLVDDLAYQMGHLLLTLQPGGFVQILGTLSSPMEGMEEAMRAEVEKRLQPLVEWLQDLVDKLDLEAIKGPLKATADVVRGTVDDLDKELASVNLEVRAIFEKVISLLDVIDTQSVTDQIKAAIQSFAAQLTKQLQTLFKPVRNAVAQILGTIDEGIEGFDPKELIEPLREAIQSLTRVLKDPGVLAPLTDIRSAIDGGTKQLENLSFAPAVDPVVAVIDEMTAALQRIDTSKLDMATKIALQGALLVLPEDLTSVTDPINAQFGVLVETGPVPILDAAKQQPEKLLDKVQSFQPAALVGTALLTPYQDLLKTMDGFQPSYLLAPIETELDKLKSRLRNDANPMAPLEALQEPFDAIKNAFDRLSPDELVKPLEQAITSVIDDILKVVPAEEVIGQIDKVVKSIQEVVAFADSLVAVFEKLHGLLEGMFDARTQFDSWLDTILDQVEAINDTSPLQPLFADVSSALDETKAASLREPFSSISQALLDKLTALEPETKLTAVLQGYQALVSLPDSLLKSQTLEALGAFNPLDPPFTAPYQALAGYSKALTQAQQSLEAALVHWDANYHAQDGLLANFRRTGATPKELREWVSQPLEQQFAQPLRVVLGMAEPLGASLGVFTAALDSLVRPLRDRLAVLVQGPDSLSGIRNELNELVEKLHSFNLGFFRDSLHEVFTKVREKLDAVNPMKLGSVVENEFNAMLNGLTLTQVLSPTEVAKLDEDYAKLVEKLKCMDPQKLVVDAMQKDFDAKITPLLAVFDLTALFTVLIERLQALEENLKAELERINQAYLAMRDAIPTISLVDIDIDIDIDVGISF